MFWSHSSSQESAIARAIGRLGFVEGTVGACFGGFGGFEGFGNFTTTIECESVDRIMSSSVDSLLIFTDFAPRCTFDHHRHP